MSVGSEGKRGGGGEEGIRGRGEGGVGGLVEGIEVL